MKAQYVGDIGDFGKVLLLKHLAACGFKIGVNWLLTGPDATGDGSLRNYPDYRGKDCLCCCGLEVLQAMTHLARTPRAKRRIESLDAIIRRFCGSLELYSEFFDSGRTRKDLDKEAFEKLNPALADLVFFDPDNGLLEGNGNSPKHIYLDNLQRYWGRGQSILVYHHLNREKKSEEEKSSHQTQVDRATRTLKNKLTNARVDSFRMRRGTARVYFLCLQPAHLPKAEGGSDISSIQPLLHTKSEWKKRAKTCNCIH